MLQTCCILSTRTILYRIHKMWLRYSRERALRRLLQRPYSLQSHDLGSYSQLRYARHLVQSITGDFTPEDILSSVMTERNGANSDVFAERTGANAGVFADMVPVRGTICFTQRRLADVPFGS